MVSEIAHGPAEVARLILAHSDLPVLKMGGDGSGEDEDFFVLELDSAWVGRWYRIPDCERVFDDIDDAREWWEVGDDPGEIRVMSGPCIWIRMDYSIAVDRGELDG